MRYKGTRKAIDEIARELNVEGIVEGTVLRSGNRVRITAQLIDTATDRHIWAENYEGDLQDIFTLQSRVAEAITGEVRVKIMPDKTGRTSTRLNPEAYEAYLKGRSYADRMTSATSEAAIRYYERAIELDSHFALANAYLAESLVLAGAGENSRKNLPRARAALDKALELDPTLSSAHTLLGMIHLSWEWDWEGAERECKRALELNPNDWAGHYGLAYYFHAMGRSREALAESDRALEIDPLSPRSITQNAYLLDCLRRHEEANRLYRKALELDPDFQRARYFLSWNDFRADLAAKNYIKAEIILRTALIQPKEQSATTRRMPSQNAATRNQEGANGLRRLQQVLDSSDGMNFVRRASAYSLLSAKDQAMQCLEQAYDMRERGLTDLLSEPDLDPLHSDRRFQALARRMSLPPPS